MKSTRNTPGSSCCGASHNRCIQKGYRSWGIQSWQTALVLGLLFLDRACGAEEGDTFGLSPEHPESTLNCHRRHYTKKITAKDENGRECWGVVNIMNCWGRCDSNEIADWKFPYKRSHHPVCLHESTKQNTVELPNCDSDVLPGTNILVFQEADVCSCALCKSSEASCEGLRYRGARRAPRDTRDQKGVPDLSEFFPNGVDIHDVDSQLDLHLNGTKNGSQIVHYKGVVNKLATNYFRNRGPSGKIIRRKRAQHSFPYTTMGFSGMKQNSELRPKSVNFNKFRMNGFEPNVEKYTLNIPWTKNAAGEGYDTVAYFLGNLMDIRRAGEDIAQRMSRLRPPIGARGRGVLSSEIESGDEVDNSQPLGANVNVFVNSELSNSTRQRFNQVNKDVDEEGSFDDVPYSIIEDRIEAEEQEYENLFSQDNAMKPMLDVKRNRVWT